jgi:hypothetical protein
MKDEGRKIVLDVAANFVEEMKSLLPKSRYIYRWF